MTQWMTYKLLEQFFNRAVSDGRTSEARKVFQHMARMIWA